MRILVVEDELDLATAIADSLRGDGYAIDLAGDAGTALGLAAVNEYDLVCLDLNLPDGDGLDVCKEITKGSAHSFDPSPAPKVIMLTARGGVSDRIIGLDQGADDYLVKPFSLGELEARVRAVLRRVGAQIDRVLMRRHRQWPAAEQRIFERDPGAARERPVAVVERAGMIQRVAQRKLKLIVEILADARLVDDDVNAVLAQVRGRSDAGQEE